MALCCYDEAYTIPTEYSRAHLAAHHADADRGNGPLRHGRSARPAPTTSRPLTNQMRAAMRADHGRGRCRRAASCQPIAEGRIQAMVSRQAYERQRKLERGEFRKVGVNCYRMEEEEGRRSSSIPTRKKSVPSRSSAWTVSGRNATMPRWPARSRTCAPPRKPDRMSCPALSRQSKPTPPSASSRSVSWKNSDGTRNRRGSSVVSQKNLIVGGTGILPVSVTGETPVPPSICPLLPETLHELTKVRP